MRRLIDRRTFVQQVGIAGAAGLVFLVFAVRLFIDWIFSVPLLLFTDALPAAALRESKRLVAGQRGEILLLLTGWGATLLLVEVLLWLIMAALNLLLLEIAGQHVAAVLTITSILAVVHFLAATLVAIAAMSSLATVVARAFLRCRPETELPTSVAGDEPA